MPWRWSEELKRYRDTTSGQMLSFAQVQDLIDQSLNIKEPVVDQLAQLLAAGQISIQDWRDRMAREIKRTYIQQAILAAGGRDQMTSRFWGSIGPLLRKQYGYLNRFAKNIAAGQLSEAQIRMRSRMYINSARSAFWRIRDFIERIKGNNEEKWIAMGDENTCSPCFEADQMGWQPIGTFAQPGSGQVLKEPPSQCEGLTKCRCRKDYRKVKKK